MFLDVPRLLDRFDAAVARLRDQHHAQGPGFSIALPVNLATWGDGGMWSTLDDLVRAEAHWLDDWRGHGAHAVLARCSSAVTPTTLHVRP